MFTQKFNNQIISSTWIKYKIWVVPPPLHLVPVIERLFVLVFVIRCVVTCEFCIWLFQQSVKAEDESARVTSPGVQNSRGPWKLKALCVSAGWRSLSRSCLKRRSWRGCPNFLSVMRPCVRRCYSVLVVFLTDRRSLSPAGRGGNFPSLGAVCCFKKVSNTGESSADNWMSCFEK